MTIKFIDGFDWLPAADAGQLSQLWTVTEDAMLVATGREGGATNSVQFVTADSDDFFERGTTVVDSELDFHVFGFAIKLDVLPATTMKIMEYIDGGATVQATMRITSAGTVVLYRGTGTALTVLSSGDILTAGVWHYIEAGMRYTDSGASGRAVMSIDGKTAVSQTGEANVTNAGVIKYRFTKDVALPVVDLDDFVYQHFTSLPSPLSAGLLGDSRVKTLIPDAATAVTDWPTLVGAPTNREAVDEAIAVDHDGATTTVATAAAADDDVYGVDAAGLDTLATIHAVAVNVVGDQDGLDVTTLVDAPSSTLEAASAPIGLASGGFNHKQHVHETYNSSAWTPADVNALEIGIRST